MNVARRESVPIGERTSDNWGRVRREAVPRQARAPSYIVDCLTVTGGPLARPPAPEGLGIRGSDPPRSACPDRHRGGLACAQPCHPPLGGRSRTIVLAGRLFSAAKRRRITSSSAAESRCGLRPRPRDRALRCGPRRPWGAAQLPGRASPELAFRIPRAVGMREAPAP